MNMEHSCNDNACGRPKYPEKPISLPFCSQQIPSKLVWNGTQTLMTSAVKLNGG